MLWFLINIGPVWPPWVKVLRTFAHPVLSLVKHAPQSGYASTSTRQESLLKLWLRNSGLLPVCQNKVRPFFTLTYRNNPGTSWSLGTVKGRLSSGVTLWPLCCESQHNGVLTSNYFSVIPICSTDRKDSNGLCTGSCNLFLWIKD